MRIKINSAKDMANMVDYLVYGGDVDVVPMVEMPLDEYEELMEPPFRIPEHVYLNEPYSVVVWEDGGKSLFKAQDGDEYDPLIGLIMCCMHGQTHNRVAVKDYEGVIRAISDAVSSPDEMLALSDALESAAFAIACVDGIGERVKELRGEVG